MIPQGAFLDPRPFGLPADSIEIILDLPVPPSVNRIRKINWTNHRSHKAWKKECWAAKYAQLGPARPYLQQYELTIILDEAKCRLDPDNALKALCDVLRENHIITDDGPKFARRIIIEWGETKDGCRVTLRSLHG